MGQVSGICLAKKTHPIWAAQSYIILYMYVSTGGGGGGGS